ncbi:MAG: NAD(P)/FAD-dependent oxidoreductase [Thermoanaerobaculia bacterium]|nr:NAD(P)/FAD-dependent oxidoreductase [Thermoanaerobaculia bacterium]
MTRTLIIGAGPAGLTTAYELTEHDLPAIVLEKDETVGGIARTESYKGYHFDIGGHRFFTKVPVIQRVWEEILDEEFLVRPRLSRIFYDGKFFDYPLKPFNALAGLGMIESIRIGSSYLKAQVFPSRPEENFEQWVVNRFGRRLYEIFFKTYTEKVWGMSCTEIRADWAAQRIKNLDLKKAVRHALFGSSGGDGTITTLIDSFYYPRLGPGMMWERCRSLLAERGVETLLDSEASALELRDGRIRSVTVASSSGERRTIEADEFVSSMPLRALVGSIRPQAPTAVLEAASRLRYRDFLTVVLIVDRAELFPDNWIYIHSPDVIVGRVQNFKNWSPDMVPDPHRTSLGLEYFVQEDDELWSMADSDLIDLGREEMARLGLVRAEEVVDGCVLRMPKAYPVYDQEYKNALAVIRDYLETIPNLQTVGRNGLHRYNNQDHSMLTGIYAARNIAGQSYDLWSVNVEQEYHEEIVDEDGGGETEATAGSGASGERLVPRRIDEPTLEELVESVFARYDRVALGVAIGSVTALTIFAATAVLLLRGGEPLGPTLSLLGNYLFGFQVSWRGALLGAFEGGLIGFGVGFVMAGLINLLVGSFETSIRRQLQLSQVLDPSHPTEG